MNEPRTHAELAAAGKARPSVLAPLRRPEPAPSLTATAIADALEGCTVGGQPIPIEDRLAIARHLEPWWRDFSVAVAEATLRRMRGGMS